MSVDFQRLAEVRARRQRRRRWVRVLVTLGVVGLVGAASVVAAPMFQGRLLPSWLNEGTPLLGLVAGRDAAVGTEEAQGRVQIVDPAAGIIRVSLGFLGLTSVELAVTEDTLIVVGDKEGGFGDIRDGGRIRAAYERRPGPWYAKRVEVVVSDP
jgi:hypothetical protein